MLITPEPVTQPGPPFSPLVFLVVSAAYIYSRPRQYEALRMHLAVSRSSEKGMRATTNLD